MFVKKIDRVFLKIIWFSKNNKMCIKLLLLKKRNIINLLCVQNLNLWNY